MLFRFAKLGDSLIRKLLLLFYVSHPGHRPSFLPLSKLTKKKLGCGKTWGYMFFLVLVSVAPASAAIVRQPYLQLVTPTSVTLVWRTDLNSADNSLVQYGTVFGTLNQSATGTAVTRPGLNVKDHIVTIAGLNGCHPIFLQCGDNE